jgi:hypothetical protein
VRRICVVLVLSLVVLGAACGAQGSSAVATAKQNYRASVAAVNADTIAERGKCLPIPGNSGHCSPPASLMDKTCVDEQRMIHAEVSLARAEGHAMSDDFPPCRTILGH